MFNHRYRYLFVALLSGYTYLNTVLCEVYFYFKIETTWYLALLTILLNTLLIWEGNRMMEVPWKKKFFPPKNKIRYLLFFYMLGNLISLLSTLTVVGVVGGWMQGHSLQENIIPFKLNIIYASLVNMLFHLMNAVMFFFNEYKKKLKEAEELRQSSIQAQMQVIKSQINPHFLFNNLNVMSGLVMKENPEASRFIEEFSRVYRYILTNQDKELVSLRQEMEFIEPYIFLLNKRFTEGLRISIDVPEEYRRRFIIPAALQMLIENAIKHNVLSRLRPLRIDVWIDDENNLVVSNNLQPKKAVESSTQIGLNNITRRYAAISDREVEIIQTETEFRVSLPLLKVNESSYAPANN